MAENNYEDNAGSTQMFRAFVETPQAQDQGNVSVHRSNGGGGGGRTGVIAIGVIVALVVVAAVVWLAVK